MVDVVYRPMPPDQEWFDRGGTRFYPRFFPVTSTSDESDVLQKITRHVINMGRDHGVKTVVVSFYGNTVQHAVQRHYPTPESKPYYVAMVGITGFYDTAEAPVKLEATETE